MSAGPSNPYEDPAAYLRGPEGMRNEVDMWYAAGGLLVQEHVRQRLGEFGGLHESRGEEVRASLPALRVLDLCTGPGTFPNYLSMFCVKLEVTGVDRNATFVAAAQERFPLWRFLCEDACTVALGERYDIITASSAYHHIEDGRKTLFLENARKHLLPGGAILMCENFLPGGQRAVAVERYYDALETHYLADNATADALACIRQTREMERAGEEEHKVPYRRFLSDVRAAGLEVEIDRVVWQPAEFRRSNAGSHALLLRLSK